MQTHEAEILKTQELIVREVNNNLRGEVQALSQSSKSTNSHRSSSSSSLEVAVSRARLVTMATTLSYTS